MNIQLRCHRTGSYLISDQLVSWVEPLPLRLFGKRTSRTRDQQEEVVESISDVTGGELGSHRRGESSRAMKIWLKMDQERSEG